LIIPEGQWAPVREHKAAWGGDGCPPGRQRGVAGKAAACENLRCPRRSRTALRRQSPAAREETTGG
jgi:hypothetical protein